MKQVQSPSKPYNQRIVTTISHYRLEGEIGHGGMGVVHRAVDTKLGRQVAIKVLPAHATSGTMTKVPMKPTRKTQKSTIPQPRFLRASSGSSI